MIGDQIKKRREELGLSQIDLAIKMGYSNRSSIAKIEKGERTVPQEKIRKFSKILSIPISCLMEEDLDDTILLKIEDISMAKTSESQLKAISKYKKEKCKRYGIQLSEIVDADIIEKLESVSSKQGYIKQLIRDDIAKERQSKSNNE